MTGKDVTDALKAFADYESAWSDQYSAMQEDARFRAGEQWPEALRSARESGANPRPCLTLDRINQYIRQVENDARQNKVAIKIRPVGLESDKDVADMLTGLVRHIEDMSRAEIAYGTALSNCAGEGLGWFRIVPVYEEGEDQCPRIMRIPNPFSVVSDPDWVEPDGDDLRDVFVIAELPVAEFRRQYPKAAKESWETDSDYPDWGGRDRIRVAERMTLSEDKENFLILADGSEFREAEYWERRKSMELSPVVGTREKTSKTVRWLKMTRAEILEETEFPASSIPVIPVVGNEHWVDGKRQLSGITRAQKDAQRMYNYGASAIVEYVALQPKAPFIGAAGQFDGHEAKWRRANIDNIPYLEYEPVDLGGHVLPAPSRQAPPFSNSGWMSALKMFDDALQASSGMYKASLGAPSNETSGKAIMARQREGDVSSFHYPDNLGLSIRRGGRILLEMIPRLYDRRRIVRLLGEDGDTEQAVLDPTIKVPRQDVKLLDGTIRKLFNPGVGRYDVSVGSGPSYSTRRQEAAEAMLEVASRNPAVWQSHGDLIARSMDWPMSEEFAERSKAMLPPHLKAEDEDQPPEVAALRAQVQQITGQAQQAIQALQAELAKAKAESEQKQAEMEIKSRELEIKAREVEVKAFEAETDRMETQAKVDAEMSNAKANSDMAAAQMLAVSPPQIDLTPVMQLIEGIAMRPEARPAVVKRGRAVKQKDGSWSMHVIEEPIKEQP